MDRCESDFFTMVLNFEESVESALFDFSPEPLDPDLCVGGGVPTLENGVLGLLGAIRCVPGEEVL